DMVSRLQYLDYSWVILSVLLSIISHFARAYRWNILISPLGYKLNIFRTFLAVMVGYFANLLLPRMGEVTKCAVLKRTDNVPLTLSLGTVVAERVLDFIVLMSLLAITIIVEYNLLKDFFFGFFYNKTSGLGENLVGIYMMGGFIILMIILVVVFGKKLFNKMRSLSFIYKFKATLKELIKGLLSIKTIENKTGFWFSTVIIWVMYYLMAYIVVFALPQTSGLGFTAGLTILVMGGLGMAAPVQGGIGTYHALVSSVLVLYGIKETDGVLFATVLHTSQTLMVLVVGGICLLFVSFSRRLILSDSTQKEVQNYDSV
ncbi:MAG: flippase-like domain-containing protein, partial [Bacteroidota bacterium]|nr:flippase-like domain-containing protein [Bacteroidota bacterium]